MIGVDPGAHAIEAIKASLAETLRQREEARAMVRRFVALSHTPGMPCVFCNQRWQHPGTCPVTAAKKLLGGAS